MATVRLDQKPRALVRAIPDSYKSALANFFGSGPKDIALARMQHQQYREALESCGVSVTMLEADHSHPDCLFVEDQAVIVDGHVLLPVPGHPSRVAEQPSTFMAPVWSINIKPRRRQVFPFRLTPLFS